MVTVLFQIRHGSAGLGLGKWIFAVPLAFVHSCATMDAVVPSVDRDRNWSIDAGHWLHYSEQYWGPRLSLYISPALNSDLAQQPLQIRITFLNGFEEPFEFDPHEVTLQLDGETYRASSTACHSGSGTDDNAVVEIRRKLSSGERAPCMILTFTASQPTQWDKVSLHIQGLTKKSIKIPVPTIKFHRERISVGSFR